MAGQSADQRFTELEKSHRELNNNQDGWRFWALRGYVQFVCPAGTALLSSVCPWSHGAEQGRGQGQGLLCASAHCCVGPLLQRHPRGSAQI